MDGPEHAASPHSSNSNASPKAQTAAAGDTPSTLNNSPLGNEVIVQAVLEDSGANYFRGRSGFEAFPGARRIYEMINNEHFQLPNKVSGQVAEIR